MVPGSVRGGRQGPLAEIIPVIVSRLRLMTRNVAPSVIPTMAAMITASAMGISPQLWRCQYGDWRGEELTAVQATAVLLAEWINNIHEDDDAALRMIMDICTGAVEESGE